MILRVDLLPRGDYEGEIVVLVDVLRSCTVAPVLFDNGLESLVMSGSIREARRIAASGGMLLVGERRGMPPEGFNHANSPAALRRFDFDAREAVVVSENAPRALPAVAGAERVFLASLYNAGAVARAVARSGATQVTIVCSGYEDQEDLDDTIAAGLIAGEVSRLTGDVRLAGAARLAVGLLRAFPDPLEALWHSAAGRELRRLEMTEDLAVASTVSQSESVPMLVDRETGRHGDLFVFRPL